MSETSLPASFPAWRLLLLGYGHVAQAFLPLLASRSAWLGHKHATDSAAGENRE